jgi:hypothetical protein
MAAARLHVPPIFVSGSPMMAGRYLWWAIIIAHEEAENAMAHLGDVLLMPVARADELPILHGIASALLSKTIRPAQGMCLPTTSPDDPLPNLLVGMGAVRAALRVPQSHASRPTDHFLHALLRTGSLLPISLLFQCNESSSPAATTLLWQTMSYGWSSMLPKPGSRLHEIGRILLDLTLQLYMSIHYINCP